MRWKICGLAILCLALILPAHAQVPPLIHFQGRVAVNGSLFGGSGKFKFAFVDGSGTTTLWSNDATGAAGGPPVSGVTLPVSNGLYSVMLGDTTLANMVEIPKSVFNSSDVWLRVWFNDGVAGFEQLVPDHRIVAVGYAMMAGSVQDGAITSSKIAPGAVGASQLAGGAAAANLNALGQAGVPNGALILSATENNPRLLNAGYVKVGVVQTGDTWRQDLHRVPAGRYAQTQVWTGGEMILWGGKGAGGSELGDGARYNPALNSWNPISDINAPLARDSHTAVWTGSDMLVWGGWNGTAAENSGSRYNPFSDTWSTLSPGGGKRSSHTAIWSGGEMILWGGSDGPNSLATGARYDPQADRWSDVNLNGAPAGRYSHTAIWTGSQMIVWGGRNANGSLNSGGRYDPVANSWSSVPMTGLTPGPRYDHTAVWTGSEMIIWAGMQQSTVVNTGGRYDPFANVWREFSTVGAPSARSSHTAVWAGTEMIVWGGENSSGAQNDLGRYSPGLGGGGMWTYIASTLPRTPMPRHHHRATWTGAEMIIWGGLNGTDAIGDGARYRPDSNQWEAMPVRPWRDAEDHKAVWTGSEMIVWQGLNHLGYRYNPAVNSWVQITTQGAPPSPRENYSAVWTGREMIVWGGVRRIPNDRPPFYLTATSLNDGRRYNPLTDAWTDVSTVDSPAGRSAADVVWTGSEMIVWAGVDSWVADLTSGYEKFSDGGRYSPDSDSWVRIPSTLENSPGHRQNHSVVWTGSEMIIWGGTDWTGASLQSGGARYKPSANSWTPVATVNGPSPRRIHTSVWTGSEMIVWGGLAGSQANILLNDGGRYNPQSNSWKPMTILNAPSPRLEHSAAWVDGAMFIYFGRGGMDRFADGGLYDPSTDTWQATTKKGGPPWRQFATAIWTGREILIWGGSDGSFDLKDSVWRYSPLKLMYLYQRP